MRVALPRNAGLQHASTVCHACDTLTANAFIFLSITFHPHPDSQHSHF
ncbi:hypothetical protein EMIT0111MI5_190009 [Burkholderia sp. IT-111MI5]